MVVNGGIGSLEAAREHLAHADGAMLGRAAYHTPYLLHQLDVAMFGGASRSRGELLHAFRPHVEAWRRAFAKTPRPNSNISTYSVK